VLFVFARIVRKFVCVTSSSALIVAPIGFMKRSWMILYLRFWKGTAFAVYYDINVSAKIMEDRNDF
jgi:hypothetical protein